MRKFDGFCESISEAIPNITSLVFTRKWMPAVFLSHLQKFTADQEVAITKVKGYSLSVQSVFQAFLAKV